MAKYSSYLKYTISFSLVLVIAGGALLYFLRTPLLDWYRVKQQADVPEAIKFDDVKFDDVVSPTPTELTPITTPTLTTPTETTSPINTPPVVPPVKINLAIPFTSQAPFANWNLPYQEACEEASILMAARFLQGRNIADANDADQAILELVDYNSTVMQQPIDTTAEQTAALLESYYQLKAEVIYDWDWDDIKVALAQGYPVIMPAAGRELGNPNFTAPGPLYHMLVIKGYTPEVIITNDPGTRRGADYQYSYETLYNANHDWNEGAVTTGRKVIIIVSPL